MVAPTFDVSKRSRVSPARGNRADAQCLRYRLDVVAASAVDVVQSAGGWLYDRAMAGWEVTVLLPERCDTRSLRILGVHTSDFEDLEDLEEQFAVPGTGSPSRSLAVSADAFATDERVRDAVLRSLENRVTEVALWGQTPQGWPLRVHRAMTSAARILSAAARTFKGYALAAAGIPGAIVGPTETLLCDAFSTNRLDQMTPFGK
jgi:hypothetical protein